jgi:hypothetical protein
MPSAANDACACTWTAGGEFDAAKLTMLNMAMAMPGGSSASSLLLVVLPGLLVSLGCGLRSDPFAPHRASEDGGSEQGDESDDSSGDPFRPGTCNDPFTMPFAPTTLRGQLSGPSFSEGWCGSDGGPEDVYTLVPDYDVDVILSLVASETEFTPTLRVVEDGCAPGSGVTPICTRSFDDQPYHFLARAGHTYSVFIDSADGGEGKYAFEVGFGWPSLALCSPHPEVIHQLPGSAFIWNNDFTEGQGRVDGYCGGPGRENMFPLVASYAGNMYARVVTTGAFAPVLSLRTDCAALSELACSADGPGGVAELVFTIVEPGQYYLVVDQAQIGAGGYQLRVDFD